jgi:hypothetical protein
MSPEAKELLGMIADLGRLPSEFRASVERAIATDGGLAPGKREDILAVLPQFVAAARRMADELEIVLREFEAGS